VVRVPFWRGRLSRFHPHILFPRNVETLILAAPPPNAAIDCTMTIQMRMKRRPRRPSLLLAAIGAAGFHGHSSLGDALSLSTSGSAGPSTATNARSSPFPGSQPATEHDRAVLRRQTGQTAPAEAAAGVPAACRCCHGFPQAFAMDPMPSASGGMKRRINSGLVKLSCPHLVSAVDELEDGGGIGAMNDAVKGSAALQRSVVLAHEVHARVRRDMLDRDGADHQKDVPMDILRQKLGERGAEAFLSSGVAGASAGSTEDVKCLHAWLGDYLFRGAENGDDADTSKAMGHAVVQALKERGVSISGTESCKSLCDPSSDAAPLPPRPRNKQRLKTGKEIARRKRRRKEEEGETKG
jgi:hypothetical protein